MTNANPFGDLLLTGRPSTFPTVFETDASLSCPEPALPIEYSGSVLHTPAPQRPTPASFFHGEPYLAHPKRDEGLPSFSSALNSSSFSATAARAAEPSHTLKRSRSPAVPVKKSPELSTFDLVPYNVNTGDSVNSKAPGKEGESCFLRSPTPLRKQRTIMACNHCRERKTKCSGTKPTCKRCAAHGYVCDYAQKPTARGPARGRAQKRGSVTSTTSAADQPPESPLFQFEQPEASPIPSPASVSSVTASSQHRHSVSSSSQSSTGSLSTRSSIDGLCLYLSRNGQPMPAGMVSGRMPSEEEEDLRIATHTPNSTCSSISQSPPCIAGSLRNSYSMPQLQGTRQPRKSSGLALYARQKSIHTHPYRPAPIQVENRSLTYRQFSAATSPEVSDISPRHDFSEYSFPSLATHITHNHHSSNSPISPMSLPFHTGLERNMAAHNTELSGYSLASSASPTNSMTPELTPLSGVYPYPQQYLGNAPSRTGYPMTEPTPSPVSNSSPQSSLGYGLDVDNQPTLTDATYLQSSTVGYEEPTAPAWPEFHNSTIEDIPIGPQ